MTSFLKKMTADELKNFLADKKSAAAFYNREVNSPDSWEERERDFVALARITEEIPAIEAEIALREETITAAMQLIGCKDRDKFMEGLARYRGEIAPHIDEPEVERIRHGSS